MLAFATLNFWVKFLQLSDKYKRIVKNERKKILSKNLLKLNAYKRRNTVKKCNISCAMRYFEHNFAILL